MARLSTNCDLRAYAAARNVRLGEVAKELGIAQSLFSARYMHTEQTAETKKYLKSVIDKIAFAKKQGA